MASYRKQIGRDGKIFTWKVTIKSHSKYLTSKTFKTKRLAQIWAKKIEDNLELMDALENEGAGMTLSELADEYFEQYKGKDQKCLFRRICWWVKQLGDKRLTEIHSKQVRTLLKQYEIGNCLKYARMRGVNTIRLIETQNSRSPATVNRMKMALSSLYKYAEEEGYLSYNPTKGIKARPENNERIRYLSDENHDPNELERLLNACQKSYWPKL